MKWNQKPFFHLLLEKSKNGGSVLSLLNCRNDFCCNDVCPKTQMNDNGTFNFFLFAQLIISTMQSFCM